MIEEDNTEEFRFRWQITNFSFIANKKGVPIDSPFFVADNLDETKWYLSIYPRGDGDYDETDDPNDNEEYVDVYLTRCSNDGGGDEIAVELTIELEAADSSLRERSESFKRIYYREDTKGFHRYIKRRTLLKDMRSTFLPDDILTVLCTLKMDVEVSTVEYITEIHCETYEETVKTEFPWTIKNWSEFSEVCGEVQFTGEQEASFRMFICESNDADKNLILKLKKIESKTENILVSCRLAILDTKGSEALSRMTHHYFDEASDMTARKLFKRAEIQDSYLKDDSLSLNCVLSTQTGKQTHKRTKTFRELTEDEDDDLEEYIRNELYGDFEKMFLSGEFSDVKLKAGSKVVNCHKSMLCARAPGLGDLVVKAAESSEGGVECVIDIKDLDGDSLEQMIYYLYTDKFIVLNFTKALKCLVAAHKYKVGGIKEICAIYLSNERFTFENIYDILIAAHISEHAYLKRRAIHYISEYFSRICLRTEWANFRKTAKDVAAYACREIRRIKML